MANLNALIAQGAQFNLPNPVDQYSKVMQLQAAQEQMQMNRQQAQQIQEDRAGFAKLRETLAGKNLTPEDYEIALTQSPDPSHQKLGIEMRFKRMRLEDLDKEMGGGVKPAAEAPNVDNVGAPMGVPSAAATPVAPKREMFVTKDSSGRSRYLVDGAEVSPQEYQSAQSGVVVGAAPAARLNAFPLPAFEPTNALAAQVAPAAAAEAPVVNAMAAKQAQIAEINRKLDVLNSPKYSDLPGAKGRIDTLERQLKQLTESPVGKVDLDKFDPASVAKFLDSGNFADLKRIETATGGRYLSLGAGRALDQETGKIISEDKIPAAAAPKIYNLRTGPHTLDEEGNLVPVPVQGGVLPAAVAAQAVAAPRIINYKGAPHTLNEAGELVPIPVAGGALPVAAAQPPAATGVKPDIRIIKGIPYTFNADSGKFVRVPVEGGLPAAAGKGGTGKQATADKPKPPIGYRYDASGENLEPIPGGPASEKLQPKEIQKREALRPQATQALKTVNNTMSIISQTVDRLLANSKGLNGITGLIGGVTPALTNEARAAKADLEQLKNLAFIQGLTELRAASKTGAGVGNVSNREGDRFENLKASLDRSQSKEDLEASLRRLKAQSEFTIQAMQEAFDSTYSYKAAAGGAPAANVDALLDKYK